MKLRTLLPFAAAPCFLSAVACTFVAQSGAQTTVKNSTVHHTSTATHSTSGAACATDLPTLSPKIPALPAGSPCPKALFTVSSVPTIHVDYTSPLESTTSLGDTLGIQSNRITLNYVDFQTGTGEPFMGSHKYLTINYTGYLVDGTKFDSSLDHKEKFSFPYGAHAVVLGWDTGFSGMRVGGKRRLFIPWQLAYGPQGKPPIPPRAMLIFDVELVAISDTDPTPHPAPAPPQPAPASPQPKPATQPPPSTSASPVKPASAPPSPSPKP